jgi:TRAP transporter TatT component family protein
LIRSCICLFYISLSAVAFAAAADDEADRLYADRANLASARRAADLWRPASAGSGSEGFDASWKLARADYWLGGHVPESERRSIYEEGIAAGRRAIALQANRPEGHFWVAANMGAMAESFGLRQGIKYRKPVREELETVLRLDPSFMQGSADRALGRWYFKVPRLFGGSDKESEAHLRASLKYNPNSTASRFFLAELYLDNDRKADARTELQAVIEAPLDPNWTPEDQEFKAKARKLLASMK